jgi:hypothetical protein
MLLPQSVNTSRTMAICFLLWLASVCAAWGAPSGQASLRRSMAKEMHKPASADTIQSASSRPPVVLRIDGKEYAGCKAWFVDISDTTCLREYGWIIDHGPNSPSQGTDSNVCFYVFYPANYDLKYAPPCIYSLFGLPETHSLGDAFGPGIVSGRSSSDDSTQARLGRSVGDSFPTRPASSPTQRPPVIRVINGIEYAGGKAWFRTMSDTTCLHDYGWIIDYWLLSPRGGKDSNVCFDVFWPVDYDLGKRPPCIYSLFGLIEENLHGNAAPRGNVIDDSSGHAMLRTLVPVNSQRALTTDTNHQLAPAAEHAIEKPAKQRQPFVRVKGGEEFIVGWARFRSMADTACLKQYGWIIDHTLGEPLTGQDSSVGYNVFWPVDYDLKTLPPCVAAVHRMHESKPLGTPR